MSDILIIPALRSNYIDKHSFEECGTREVRNDFPRITFKSRMGVPMEIYANAEGVEGLIDPGKSPARSWIIIGDIKVDVSIPKLSWKDRLRILFSGEV